MLIIDHLNGPLAGTQARIEPNATRVTVGRARDCRVVYPPAAAGIARRHCALVRDGKGEWTVEPLGDAFVEIDGVATRQAKKIGDGSRITLGASDGPAFRTLIQASPADTPADPALVQPSPATRAPMRLPKAAIAGAVVAVIAGSVALYQSFTSTPPPRGDELARLRAAQVAAAERSIGAPVREHLMRSVFQVMRKEPDGTLKAIGTAWPVGPRRVATTARIEAEAGAAGSIVVRAPGRDGATFEVVAHQQHPGYRALQDVRAPEKAGGKDADDPSRGSAIAAAGYDVALLEVDRDIPAQQRFTLATPQELHALHAGEPVASAGYAARNAGPTLDVGTLTGLTDVFFLPGDEAHRQLVQHDLPAGAGGSPIVNAAGHVVAVMNGSNVVTFGDQAGSGRRDDPDQIHFGQRIDALKDLIDGTAARHVESDRAYWAKQIAVFRQGGALRVEALVERAKPSPDAQASSITSNTRRLTAADRMSTPGGGARREASIPMQVEPGATYVFVAASHDGARLDLYLLADDKIVDRSAGTPVLRYRAGPSANVTLLVASPDDRDVVFTLRSYRFDKPASG